MELVWIGLGFAAFGLLVGTTAGLSSAELTITLLGLLFALIGGSLTALLSKLDSDGKKFSGVALVAFSTFATAGIYSGIYVRINDVLRIQPLVTSVVADAKPTKLTGDVKQTELQHPNDYLKSYGSSLETHLTREVYAEKLSLPEACEMLRDRSASSVRK